MANEVASQARKVYFTQTLGEWADLKELFLVILWIAGLTFLCDCMHKKNYWNFAFGKGWRMRWLEAKTGGLRPTGDDWPVISIGRLFTNKDILRGKSVQMKAEPSLLEFCWVQPDLFKVVASEGRDSSLLEGYAEWRPTYAKSVQMRAEPNLLEFCWVQPDLLKVVASEGRDSSLLEGYAEWRPTYVSCTWESQWIGWEWII